MGLFFQITYEDHCTEGPERRHGKQKESDVNNVNPTIRLENNMRIQEPENHQNGSRYCASSQYGAEHIPQYQKSYNADNCPNKPIGDPGNHMKTKGRNNTI
jgi:hypothetical protein